MISRSKMSDYARSMIFSKPDPQYGLNRRSVFNLIKFFRSMSKLSDNRGLSKFSYRERESLIKRSKRSFSWYKNDRALDDLVTREIEPLSWKTNNDSYKKIDLDIYSYICYKGIRKFMNTKDVRIK